MTDHPSALRLLSATLAGILRPREPVRLSRWLESNLVLIDGPDAGDYWQASGAPYLAEIADCLGDDHPCNEVIVRKAQQTGASILALGWTLYIAECEPANVLYGVPGIDALREMNSQKLQPLIDAWEKRTRKQVIIPQTSRSGSGSTTYEKRFQGGFLFLANANSIMDLSSKTIKKGVMDELSKWEDIPGRGDPENLYFGRFTAFRRLKTYKILKISTPEMDTGDDTGQSPGHCRIDRAFIRSDRRFWHIACPECGSRFRHDIKHFQIDERHPHKSVYICQDCGHFISESERITAIDDGIWQKTVESEGRPPGFHIDAFISKMMSYEAIAEDALKARSSEKDMKDFHNLVLGLPYKYKGDAPDWERIFERREDYPRGRIPAEGLIITCFVDVQHYGLYYEVTAWAPDKRSWTVDIGLIGGDTTDHRRGAWAQLTEVYERRYEDPWGNRRGIDRMGVDAGDGGRSNQVYAWTAQRLNAMAMKGEDGWSHPAISSAAKLVDFSLDEGQPVKNGARLWKTGTWSLKRELYDNLRKPRLTEGGQLNPGFCHFGLWLDQSYFKQLTAEYLDDIIVKGRVTGRRWVKRGENHYLDCRIGNMALAEHLGLSDISPDQWRALAAHYGVPSEALQPDLFTPPPLRARGETVAADPAAIANETPEPAPQRSETHGWFAGRTQGWLNR